MKLSGVILFATACTAATTMAKPSPLKTLSKTSSDTSSAKIRGLGEQDALKKVVNEAEVRGNGFAEFVRSEPIIEAEDDGNFTVETPPERPSSAPLKF